MKEEPGQRAAAEHGGETLRLSTISSRVWDAVKNIATVTDQLGTLAKEDARIQSQVTELVRLVFDLTKEVRDLSGQMKCIEKRLEQQDKLIEMTIKLRIMEEVEKLRAEFKRPQG